MSETADSTKDPRHRPIASSTESAWYRDHRAPAADTVPATALATAWEDFEVPAHTRGGQVTLNLHDHLASYVPKRPGAFLRISSDRFGLETGVDRRLEDAEDSRARLRWGPFVKVYKENGTSAFKKRKITKPDGTLRLGRPATRVPSTARRPRPRRDRRRHLLRPRPARPSATRPRRPHRHRRVRPTPRHGSHRRADAPDQRQRPSHGPHDVRDGAEVLRGHRASRRPPTSPGCPKRRGPRADRPRMDPQGRA